jgi:hypothetical protein
VVYAEIPDLSDFPWLEEHAPDFVFFNSLLHPDEWAWRRFQVISVRHPQLGSLSAIRTGRFGVYEFVTGMGRTYEVEAEEGPGVCYDTSVSISDWGAVVEVSEDIEQAAPNHT